jgi:outer membrane protein assembly factor BamB
MPNDEDPSYTTNIAWESDTFVAHHYRSVTIVNSAVYIFGAAASDSEGEMLVKVDANNGSVIWKTDPFPIAELISPKVIDDYVYVFIGKSLIYSFEEKTGELSAIIDTDMEIDWSVIAYKNYLYFGAGIGSGEHYLVRLNTADIDRTMNVTESQHIIPEVIWTTETGKVVWAEPVVKDNIIYTHTYPASYDVPVEFVGINMDTKDIEWYKQINYDDGWSQYSLSIHEDIIYILSSSISAYNLNTGEQVFLKTFSDDTPDKELYSPADSLGQTYHEGKIYFTNGSSRYSGDGDDYQNIFCIDAQTGELVWSDIPLDSESLGTNPIIHNNRMYVPHHYGLRVYNPKNGKLIGVDKSFCGAGRGRNLLYNNYMITVRCDENTGDGTLVALNLGG